MVERIDRHDDENLYQPRIHSRWIRELHALSGKTGLPMTVLLDKAVREFCESYKISRMTPERIPFHKTYEIVGWAYEAGLHCNACAYDRFKELLTSEEVAKDGEGNPIRPLFVGDIQGDEYCGDCGRRLDD